MLYGSTAGGIAYNLGITQGEAQALIDLYFTAYPLIKKYIEDTHAQASDNGLIVTPFGRRKMAYGSKNIFRWTAAYNATLRQMQNCMIQSTTSDVGLFCFMHVNNEMKKLGGRTLATIFDSVEIELPFENMELGVEALFKCMDDLPVQIFPWLTLPIGMEAEIGYNWGELSTVHRGMKQDELERILNG